jgi:hypothetical protein
MNGKPKTSPWVYVGIGCTAVVVLIVAGVASVSFFGYRWAKRMEADMKDPAARESRVKQVLGCQSLPEGYHPMVSVSIPFVMEMAMLSDRDPDDEGRIHGFEKRGFLYFQFLNMGSNEQELRDYFEGKTQDDSVLRRHHINVHMRSREQIKRGVIDMEDHRVMYLAQRGHLDMAEGRAEGVSSLLLIDCPQDSRRRMAIWFGPDPDSKAPVAKADFSGTPADEAAIRGFVGHFQLCHKS